MTGCEELTVQLQNTVNGHQSVHFQLTNQAPLNPQMEETVTILPFVVWSRVQRKCKNAISPAKFRAKCAVCCGEYHLNNNCVGVKEQSWKTKSSEGCENWTCLNCQTPLQKNSLTQDSTSLPDTAKRNASKKRKQFELENNGEVKNHSTSLTESKARLLSAFTVMLEKEFGEELSPLKEKIIEIEDAVNQNQEQTEELDKRILELAAECEGQDELIEQLNQYSRRNNVVIDGVPEIEGETPRRWKQRK